MKSLKTDVHFSDITLEALSRQEDKSDNLNVQTASTQRMRDIFFGGLFLFFKLNAAELTLWKMLNASGSLSSHMVKV